MLRNEAIRKEAQAGLKAHKALIPKVQQRKLAKSLPDASHWGRDALWGFMQKALPGKGLQRTVKQVFHCNWVWSPCISHAYCVVRSQPSLTEGYSL